MIKTDQKILDEAVKLYLSGKAATKISKLLYIGVTTITNELKRRNIPIRYKKRNTVKKCSETILEMYDNNFSIIEIANKTNIDQSCIGRFLRKKNLTTNNYINQSISDKIIQLYVDGYSLNQIANLLSINSITAYNHCKKQNITLRPVGSKLEIE
ncbi:MAG TPA: hypothetical protein VII94_04825, partial [Candidatus Saccharimonadales bacterium]